MKPISRSTFNGKGSELKVGMHVVHRDRLELGIGQVSDVYDDQCEIKFLDSLFKCGVFSNAFCSVDIGDRLWVLANAKANDWLEQKKARQIQINRLKLYASMDGIASVMNDLSKLLNNKQTDSDWQDALTEFWTKRAPVVEDAPLIPFAPPWWKEKYWLKVCYTPLSVEDRLQVLSQPSLQLSQALRKQLVQDIANRHSTSESFSDLFRQCSVRLRFELLECLQGVLPQSVEISVAQALSETSVMDSILVPPRLIEDFWTRYKKLLHRDSPLFHYAPIKLQRKILQMHFRRHLEKIDFLFHHNANTSGNWIATHAYDALAVEDYKLATLWSSSKADEYEIARMLSARAAEKIAFWFYSRLNITVTDVAIHQLTGQSTQWKTHDLVLNGVEPLDVKNARLPYHSKAFYVEHTVPRFKKDRRNREVTIAAVVSPYLSLKNIRHPEDVNFEVSDVQFLGETSLGAITQVGKLFTKNALEVHDLAEGAFIPPWYFDFPNAWYREFDESCTLLHQIEYPGEFDTQLLYENRIDLFPMAQYIAVGLFLPAWVTNSMEPWMRKLIGKLQDSSKPRVKLPYLYLLLLSDFLDQIRQPTHSSYEPSSYLKLLYQAVGADGAISHLRPLGIEDPLRTIVTLCESLQQLWSERKNLNLERFTEYRLTLGGILQGRESRGDYWETVLAYCGGYVEGKGKCGCAPLILGRERQCPVCRKLICCKCHYCSDGCLRDSASRSTHRRPITHFPE